jgi:hypothetical protein
MIIDILYSVLFFGMIVGASLLLVAAFAPGAISLVWGERW